MWRNCFFAGTQDIRERAPTTIQKVFDISREYNRRLRGPTFGPTYGLWTNFPHGSWSIHSCARRNPPLGMLPGPTPPPTGGTPNPPPSLTRPARTHNTIFRRILTNNYESIFTDVLSKRLLLPPSKPLTTAQTTLRPFPIPQSECVLVTCNG